MLQRVKLPIGWKKIVGSNAMYEYIVDDRGRMRVEIISYEKRTRHQKVFMHRCCRFRRSFNYDHLDKEHVGVTYVTNGGKWIYTAEPVVAGSGDVTVMANAAASAWLDKYYPKWRDPSAYWD